MIRVFLMGKIATSPESGITKTGLNLLNFTVLVKQDPTNNVLYNVTVFGKLAEELHKTLDKGTRVFLDGKLQQQTYTDAKGEKTRVNIVAQNVQLPDADEAPVVKAKVAPKSGTKSEEIDLLSDFDDKDFFN